MEVDPFGHPVRLTESMPPAVRVRHLGHRTERANPGWTLRFLRFRGTCHLVMMGAAEVNAFLSHLATHRDVRCTRGTPPALALTVL